MYLLFDLDGTLIDSAEGIQWSLQETFKELQLPVPSQELIPIGPAILTTLQQLLPSDKKDLFEKAKSLYQKFYHEKGATLFSVYPEVENSLRELKKQGHSLYIITSKAEKFAKQIIDALEWNSYFVKIYGSGLNGEFLDKSKLLSHLLLQEQLNSKECLLIGDRYHDLLAAQKNECPSLAVLWGYGSAAEFAPYSPIKILQYPKDLLTI